MAIPKHLRRITEKQAKGIVKRHPDGEWEGRPWDSDFIYEGRKAPNKPWKYYEMLRVTNICGITEYETGRVSL